VSKRFFELVNELPRDNLTVKSLQALDFIIPGEWINRVGFDNTVRAVTGETDKTLMEEIGKRAVELFEDKKLGYQKALWLYQTIDKTDSLLATTALANKVGEKISLLGFLNKITPNSDKLQSIDFGLKLLTEIVAFSQINGIPRDNIGDFVASLSDYANESKMRLTALVCFDGLIPLGPDFLQKIEAGLKETSPEDLAKNPKFNQINDEIPGGDSSSKLEFIISSFDAVKGWISNFVDDHSLSREQILNNIKGFVDFSEDNLDYLAAFLDMSTNYYEHTGIQSIARSLIEKAMQER